MWQARFCRWSALSAAISQTSSGISNHCFFPLEVDEHTKYVFFFCGRLAIFPCHRHSNTTVLILFRWIRKVMFISPCTTSHAYHKLDNNPSVPRNTDAKSTQTYVENIHLHCIYWKGKAILKCWCENNPKMIKKVCKQKKRVSRSAIIRAETSLRPPTQYTYIPNPLCCITAQNELGT